MKCLLALALLLTAVKQAREANANFAQA